MFAFTHLVSAWLLGKAYEKIGKTSLSQLTWFIFLFGSLLPDGDYLLDWLFGTELHRTFTHSFLGVLMGAGLLWLYLRWRKHPQSLALAGALALGMGSHLLVDMVGGQGIPLFWPSLLNVSFTHWGYFDPATPSFLNQSYTLLRQAMKLALVDMAIGTAWLFYLWWRKKLEF